VEAVHWIWTALDNIAAGQGLYKLGKQVIGSDFALYYLSKTGPVRGPAHES